MDSLLPVLFIICATGDKTMKQGGISFRLFRNDDEANFCKAKLGDSDLSCTRTFPERRRSEQKRRQKQKKKKIPVSRNPETQNIVAIESYGCLGRIIKYYGCKISFTAAIFLLR